MHNQSALADDPLSPALFTESVECCATSSHTVLEHITNLFQQHRCCYRLSLHNQSTLADDPLSPALFTEALECYATASQMALEHITNLLIATGRLCTTSPPWQTTP